MLGNSEIPYDKKRPERVSIAGQVILCILSPLWIIALYRIKKLRLGAALYVGGFMAVMGLLIIVGNVSEEAGYLMIPIMISPAVILIFFVIRWSREWNANIVDW